MNAIDQDELMRLLLEGFRLSEAARRIGVSRQAVHSMKDRMLLRLIAKRAMIDQAIAALEELKQDTGKE